MSVLDSLPPGMARALGGLTHGRLIAKMVKPLPPLRLVPDRTALLLIDMQVTASASAMVEIAAGAGLPEHFARGALGEFDRRFQTALRQAARVLQACRESGIRPIHVKLQSRTPDGADMGRLQKLHGLRLPPQSPHAQFLPEVAPKKDEIVLTKTSSGPFTSTVLDRLLRTIGIDELIVVGFYTEQCIETTIRDAADLGYDVLAVTDACSSLLPGANKASFRSIGNIYCRLTTADALVQRLSAEAAPASVSAPGRPKEWQ